MTQLHLKPTSITCPQFLSHSLMLMSLSAALCPLVSFNERTSSSLLHFHKQKVPPCCLQVLQLLQQQPSPFPLVCPNPPSHLQECVCQTYKANLFKVEILLICMAYCTKRTTCFFILFHNVKTKRLRLPIIQCVTLSAVLLLYLQTGFCLTAQYIMQACT